MSDIVQRTIEFYGDEIIAVQRPNGQIYVPVRQICRILGVDWSSQRKRIERDDVLSDVVELVGVVITTTPHQESQFQDATCLPLEYLSGFLFGINASRVREDVRAKLVKYKRDCYAVLSEAFLGGKMTTRDSLLELLNNPDDALVQTYLQAEAIAQIARNQLVIQSGVNRNAERLDAIEIRLGENPILVTDSQASQISQSVKAIAVAMNENEKGNYFGAVYGEFYRRFGITSYKQLPAERFNEAMAFFREYYQTISNKDIPF